MVARKKIAEAANTLIDMAGTSSLKLTALIFSISRNFETEGDTTRKLKRN